MFVQTNTVKSIKAYFNERLAERFSKNEIKLIGNEVICLRLGLSCSDLIGINDHLLSESDLLYFRSIVKRLLNNEPFQYVIGNTHFYGLDLKCDKRGLIPRPETEELVDWIKESFPHSFKGTFVDLCAGSACIALALKSIFPNALVSATDFSEEALVLGKENAVRVGLDLQFFQFDARNEEAFDILDLYNDNGFDCWISNPPYIPLREKESMNENVLNHEPHMALFVTDEDPLLFYRIISNVAKEKLKSKGFLFFEIHENLSDDVINILKNSGFINIELRKDLQGKSRMLKAEKV